MNDRTPSTNSPAQAPARGRRRFLGAGVSATPALLTLASQPALGVTCFTPSRSLSRNTSVSQAGKNGECNGQSPGNYGAQTQPGSPAYTWPAQVPPETPFHSVFSGTRFMITILVVEEVIEQTTKPSGKDNSPPKKTLRETTGSRSLSLWEVITLNPRSAPADLAPGSDLPRDPANLGKHMAAAYLNCINGFIPDHILTIKRNALGKPSLEEIWDEWDSTDRYEVTAGVFWTASDIVSYLSSNGIAP